MSHVSVTTPRGAPGFVPPHSSLTAATAVHPLATGPSHAATVVRALAACGVPFVAYDAAGARGTVSDDAVELLAPDPAAPAVWRRADTIAAAALARRGRTCGDAAPVAEGHWWLRAQALPLGDARHAAVVVFLPAPADTMDTGPSVDVAAWHLTAREAEVVGLIARGESTKGIAAALDISPHTARRHTERVFAKLGVRSRAQVVRLLAVRVPPPDAGSRPASH